MAVTENTTTEGKVKTTKRTGTATAMVSPAAPAGTPTTVPVNETEVTTDEFVLDPASADAVQEGPMGDLDLPIHALEDGVPDFSDPEPEV